MRIRHIRSDRGNDFYETPEVAPGKHCIDGGKTGQDVQCAARDGAVLVSLALQHGATVERFRHAITRRGNGVGASFLGVVPDSLTNSHSAGA